MSSSLASERKTPKSQTKVASDAPTISWGVSLCLAGTVIGYLPVLSTYFSQLWGREYYQFFPFAILSTFGLAVVRATNYPHAEAGKLRWATRILAAMGSTALLAAGASMGSTWPCFVSFVLVVGIILDMWSEKDRRGSLLYLTLPLLIVIRPPMGLDELAIQRLQTLTSEVASSLLSYN